MNLHLIRKALFQGKIKAAVKPDLSRVTGIVLILSFTSFYMGSQAQTISMVKKRMSAEKVITTIQEQSGYNVLYASGLVDKGSKTDVSFDKATLTEALDAAVNMQPYVYELIGKTIVLKSRKEDKVKDGSSLKSKEEKQEDMFNNGYQSVNKTQSTGSYSQVNKEEFVRNPSTSVLDQLKKLPGVTVSGNSIVIRGINTLLGSTDPLILLDGISFSPSDINSIDPNSVQSMTVLKDASETAMYGSRGANGVILITTRHGGKSGQDKEDLGSISNNKDGSVQLKRANVTILLTAISQWYELRLSFEGGTPEGNYSGRLTKDIPLVEMIYILQTAGIRLKQDGKNIVVSS